MKHLFSLLVFTLAFAAAGLSATITSTGTGNWNAAGTWDSGTIPTSSDDVVIALGHVVTINITNAACNNLTVNGSLTFANTNGLGITINGNVLINGSFNTYQTGNPTGTLVQTITVYGNFTVASGGVYDMRRGSSANIGTGTTVFTGSSNSIISLARTAYSSSGEEFNAVTINKTGSAKVILASGNLFMANNNSNGASVLTLTNGIIETGSNVWVVLSTSSSGVTGASAASYVSGNFGRGLSNSGSTSRVFEVGDDNGYRPMTVKVSRLDSSGTYMVVGVVDGNANNGSTLDPAIQKVSAVRYYKLTFVQGTGISTYSTVNGVLVSYGADDGVTEGNTDLRVAYSTNNRANWTAFDQPTYTTSLASPPTTITPSVLSSDIVLTDGASMFVSLATANTGTNALPVELQSFTAQTRSGVVELAWSTATEVNNAGFDIEKLADGTWTSIGFVAGAGTSNSPKQYAFAEKNVASGSYSYRLKQIDRDGKVEYSKPVSVNVVGAPTELSLIGNYPNPFNPATTVKFTVPSEGRAVVKIFNILGSEVAEIFNEAVVSGKEYSASFNASSLPSGIYFSRLEFGGQKMVKKMMLMK